MKKLAIKLVNLLIKKRISISFAESCTGGLLSSAITSIPHASKVFKMGLITYSNHSKNKLLKISKNLLNKLIELISTLLNRLFLVKSPHVIDVLPISIASFI